MHSASSSIVLVRPEVCVMLCWSRDCFDAGQIEIDQSVNDELKDGVDRMNGGISPQKSAHWLTIVAQQHVTQRRFRGSKVSLLPM